MSQGVRRKIYPPVWLLLGIITVFCLNEFLPGYRFTSFAGQVIGGVIILVGLVLLVIANGLFTQAGTNVIPFREATALVTTGIYRLTRNPMYLGMLSVLLGCAITVGAVTALAVPVVFAAIIQSRFILHEEAMLREVFGSEYEDYCARVRRWL
ncbi:MAG: isoprenylcysteine carboxylmethyltransferase family protein [Halioglobus sp.]|nr:isoprenylcysteine carboxylmethyltransferase family protein [Halioglobus sp.]